MGLDDLLDDGIGRALVRLVLVVLRFLAFLGWDCFIDGVGWRIGWVFYRGITFGRFPEEGFSDHEGAPFLTLIVVDLTGLGLLGLLIAWLSQFA